MMEHIKNKAPKRKPTHMKSFDYSENYRYFITICADKKRDLFSPTSHAVVCTLKSLVTRECRRTGYMDKVWQRGYYDHVIRGENDYRKIWDYIDNNPAHWAEDEC
jgi:REP element-mobilizing transposase RayT